eukprot:3843626-Rhodomonas_salina.3
MHPSKLGSVGQKAYILVDEFQDVSDDQMELLKLLLKNKRNTGAITVCGDQDQTIYSFVHGAARDNFASDSATALRALYPMPGTDAGYSATNRLRYPVLM